MKRILLLLLCIVCHCSWTFAHYIPSDNAFLCVNGKNRFTRALYGGLTDYRIETSDRPIFAVAKKGHYRSVRFEVGGMPLENAAFCQAAYVDGMRRYVLQDERLKCVSAVGVLRINVVALHDEEGAIFQFIADKSTQPLQVKVKLCDIANTKLHRNGDLGVDRADSFEPAPDESGLVVGEASHTLNFAHVVLKVDQIGPVGDISAFQMFNDAVAYNRQLAQRIQFRTPDPYINALGGALVVAADGDWDGKTWLHGCIGWRMPLAGWRAAYMGDVLGWNERAVSHFDAYAKSQVTGVPAVIPHPSQDMSQNMSRADKSWGTQMYSDGYICRNPERNDQMHHYDMNLNYIDELLWHFQYDADPAYMRKMWPVIKSHLAWEKRNFDPDGDHLYDAYCCIWASDALYYNGGAVTHSSAYNYRGNKLAARIAEIIGEDPTPYRQEAEAILEAMNRRLWMPEKGVWAEYEDAMGLKRKHDHPAVWSIYTPIDCGVASPQQAYAATQYVDTNIPHIDVEDTAYQTIATSDWMPYSWSINNVAGAEVMHTALAYFQAGRNEEGYRLMKGNIMDNMYYGQSPANFGQLSFYDAARGECYRDFGDCIGISSRALLQGLFGIIPDALNGQCIIRPGFPKEWDRVEVKTPYIEYRYTRNGNQAKLEIEQNFPQALKMIVRHNLGGGDYRDTEGTTEKRQVITYDCDRPQTDDACITKSEKKDSPYRLGLSEPYIYKSFKRQSIDALFNANVTDIFKNKYMTPRPATTTLEIPVQGGGDWCHPQYTPTINDSVLRSLVKKERIMLAGVSFRMPREGRNIAYTSLWNNYPDSIVVPLKGSASTAYLLMAGSTNHMQSHIDNGLVVANYLDGTTDTLRLRNPENWCPIEQDYYVDGKAFSTGVRERGGEVRPYRVCLGKATADGQPLVSRDLGKTLNLNGADGREIPGGAAQILSMPLNRHKKLKSLTVRTLSNDVVIGLMAVTLQ